MLSLFVIFNLLWVLFLEHKTELGFLQITEETEVIVNSIEDGVCES